MSSNPMRRRGARSLPELPVRSASAKSFSDHRRRCLLILGGAVWLSSGCKRELEIQPPPPPTVTVAFPQREDVTEFFEFTGTTEASESVEVRARVEGFLESVLFNPGSLVKAGDLLYKIDQAPFRARLKQMEAERDSAIANEQRLSHEFDRVTRLREGNRATETEAINAKADLESARAMIKAAEAAVDTAQINLSYTEIRAPISGRISRTFVDAGNLVGAGEYTLLTTIVQDNPIYVYFNPSETELLNYLALHPERRTSTMNEGTPVLMGLPNEDDYPHNGRTDWGDNRVNPDTGTITVRGVFENEDHALLPGLFVRVRVPSELRESALLVPARAVGLDPGGNFVLVVNNENHVQQRYVQLGVETDGRRVVLNGLDDNERIIVRGVQRVRDGAVVTPQIEGAMAEAADPTRTKNTIQPDAAAADPESPPTQDANPSVSEERD
ncbi:MAG: efflux RND transporter periplasmic adaptor subunit [Phycisphaerae bacterium]